VAARVFLPLVGLLEDGRLPLPRGAGFEGLNFAVLGAAAGAGLGVCQAAALWPRVGGRGALAWVVATAGGTALGLGLARGGDALLGMIGAGGLFRVVDEGVWRMVAFALLGAAVGGGQWLVLRRLARAGWWVPGCAVATVATERVLGPLGMLLVEVGVPFWLSLGFFGVVTGVILVVLPRRELVERGVQSPTSLEEGLDRR
jgi:hypothetical protein